MGRALLFGGGRVLAFLVAATGFGIDASGISLMGFSSNGLRLTAVVAFISFVGLTLWREIELFLRPHPRVYFDGLSPATSPVQNINFYGEVVVKFGYFFRLAFKNKAKLPAGTESTAQAMTAFIKVIDSENNLIASWEGRWANKDEPHSSGEKWLADRIDLAANNQQAILDIGLRYERESEFQGWDNGRYIGASPRRVFPPGCYELQVILAASNFKEKTWLFSLNIPKEPQSDRDNVEMKRIKTPGLVRKALGFNGLRSVSLNRYSLLRLLKRHSNSSR